jgi:hypothetical protein
VPIFNSTAVRRAEYDSSTAVLSLWFAESGGPYDYFMVPARIYEGLCSAASKGIYFNQHIRDQYTSRKR